MGLTRHLQLGFLLLVTTTHLCVHAASFPEDSTPLNTVDHLYSRQYPVFRGRLSGGEPQHRLDFQLMTKIQDTLFIAGRDQVYLVSLRESYRNEIIPYRKLTWRSGQADRETCAMKGKHRDECHNFIKVLAPRNDDLVFICGTNGFNPMCRFYRLDNLEFDGEEISGLARCPFDAKQTNVALFADGKLYSATVADFLASDAVIYRSMGDGSALRTIKYDSKWLKEPHFLHAVNYGNYVYFFFREIAAEYNSLGKAVYSRVARICKNDVGGSQRVLEKHWTSFVKARLNCSVPGESFFYFDVLQSVTDILDIDGVPTVVGVFTTQLNSIPGSAVCAFSMADIEKAFHGQFKEQKTPDSVWTAFPEHRLPKPRPGCCAGHGPAEGLKTSIEFPDETLLFIKSHPLMDAAVPPVSEEPWFTKTRVRYRLTAVAVDNSAGPHQNYTVVFVGSEAGVVLKFLAKTSRRSLNDSVLLEEIDVFNRAKCLSSSEEDRRILSLHLDQETHGLYVAFSSCVIRLPLSRCARYASCHKSCIASRDPYCGWMAHGSCEKIPAGQLSGYEQDVEYGNTAHLGDCHEFLAATSTPDYKSFGDPTSDMELSSTSVTTRPGPVETSPLTTTHAPQLTASREFELRDGPASAPPPFESPPGGPEGVWEVQSAEASQLVHMNVLITCVFAAFLLGATIAGLAVYCYRDAVLRKPRRVHKDGGDSSAAQSCSDSPGSFAKLHGLFDSPVKEYQPGVESPKLYTDLLVPGNDPPPPGGNAKPSVQPPELSALPTPESTPVLQQKSLQPIRSQWEKAQGKVAPSHHHRGELASPKSPVQYFPSSPPPGPGHAHIPSAVVLPNATHEYRASFSSASFSSTDADRKLQSDAPGSGSAPGARPGRKERRRSVDARNTLNDLLRHINECCADGGGVLGPHQAGGRAQHPPYAHRGLDTLERQRAYHLHRGAQRHSISALPKNMSPPSGMGMGVGVAVSRQPSLNRGGGYLPPTPPSRLESHGRGGAGGGPSLSRQSSYSGQGSLPRTGGGGLKRTPSIKPDVPPKPNGFVPQTAQIRVVNKYSY
ncbi:hypothetical protein AAFF_G00068080 [Aldrovandia affinis]|uniref:Sema domain-containing protein n=1 Tax=Aldrovandia affinis TaxID=143900 RepID=A0AAD7RZP9_9TELE|nr:hypothetical protein AAFF_G00068080 [Aldrovandia affinis]